MEDGLGAPEKKAAETFGGLVLILVLVEDGLGDLDIYQIRCYSGCLNPCFSGGWSRSGGQTYKWPTTTQS